jgi:hypothetical protein
VRLMDARYGQCRAILGYIGGRCVDAVICARPVVPTTSWCPGHHALYVQQADYRADRRWIRRILTAPSSADGRRSESMAPLGSIILPSGHVIVAGDADRVGIQSPQHKALSSAYLKGKPVIVLWCLSLRRPVHFVAGLLREKPGLIKENLE